MANIERKVIRANRFVLEDENGTPRAMLGVSNEGGLVLSLFDENGNARATLGVSSDDATALSLFDKDGKVIWQAP